ncbi:MAG: Fic family protein [Bacilli bacterium]|nr:Fic family protein [Bacilli bacterium]
MKNYISPFEISNTMLNYVSSIMEKVGKLSNYTNLDKKPILRRNNRIKSIHSSLAIEANSLSLNQVKDVINGKIVLGKQKEIQEVKNAFKAYEEIKEYNPYSLDDLKKSHGILTYLTLDEAGKFRNGEEGVFDGNKCIFMAPPAKNVPKLMSDLFEWMNNNKDKINPLILSSVFHYEFVFIHPFVDGNGRCARLWQNVILTKYKDIFECLPIETQIRKYQDEYYEAIAICNSEGKSNKFIEFMLRMIDETLIEFIFLSETASLYDNIYVAKLLNVMEYNIPMTAHDIMLKLGIKSKETFRANYLNPAIKAGLVNLTIPDKPTSKNQMYYKI